MIDCRTFFKIRSICGKQHAEIYSKVSEVGFVEGTGEFTGFYSMKEDHVDYLVMKKYLGKYELDRKKISSERREEAEGLLIDRREEVMPVLRRTVELWDKINK